MNRMFQFSQAGKAIAIVEARSRSAARNRASLVSHIIFISADCKVRVINDSTLQNVMVFREGFLARMEQTIEEAMAEAEFFYCPPELAS
jgi:hypothetical protein